MHSSLQERRTGVKKESSPWVVRGVGYAKRSPRESPVSKGGDLCIVEVADRILGAAESGGVHFRQESGGSP